MSSTALQQEILDELSIGMQSQIDFEILSGILVDVCGWQRVDLERFKNNQQAVDITTWCHDNIKGEWKRNGCRFIFESAKDATWFLLKYGS